MADPVTHKKFPLPPRVEMPFHPPPDVAEEIVIDIMNEAFSRSHQRIDTVLATLGEDAVTRVQEMAAKVGASAQNFLRQTIRTISAAYIGCRTGLLTVSEHGTGRNVTSGVISNELTELADMIGPNITEQIYRTLTGNIDAVLEERFGRGNSGKYK